MAKSTFQKPPFKKDKASPNLDENSRPSRNLDPLQKNPVLLDSEDMKKLKGILNGRQT